MSLSKTFLLTIALASRALAGPKGKMTLPDFTKGDPIIKMIDSTSLYARL